MISKYRNFSSYSYYSIARFLHGHILFHLDNPDPVERETISNPNQKNSNTGRILESNPAGYLDLLGFGLDIIFLSTGLSR